MLEAKLINYEMNKEFLQNVPHERFLDLAIVPFIKVMERGASTVTATVTRELQSAWQISTEELIAIALNNSKGDVRFAEMNQILTSMGMPELASSEEPDKLYIMTNHRLSNGAITLVQKDTIRNFAERVGIEKFIIIPSSIHECILFQYVEGRNDLEELKGMVKQVNEETLSREEILSYNIYLYDRATNELTIA